MSIEQWENQVHALVDWDINAARVRAAEAPAEGPEAPLAGWSVAVKDIMDVAGIPTRCGVTFLPPEPAQRDATVVEALKSKGAFVMAKAVTTAFAYLDPGPTRNPWNLERTPGGSSSGSAAAVACGMVRLALGSQTVGSIGRPAAFCGVVGFKPTYGRLPTNGVFPLSPGVDTVGFFTADVADAQHVWAALTAEDPTPAPPSLRVGLITEMNCNQAEPVMLQAVKEAGERLARAGHQVQPAEWSPVANNAARDHAFLVSAEAAHSHQVMFSRYGPAYTKKMRALIIRGQAVAESQIQEIQAQRSKAIKAVDKIFDHFDLLLTPSASGPAPLIESTGDPRMNLITSYLGVPALTLPTQLDHLGLPLGLQLIGRRETDQSLLAMALEIEKILGFNARTPPLKRKADV